LYQSAVVTVPVTNAAYLVGFRRT